MKQTENKNQGTQVSTSTDDKVIKETCPLRGIVNFCEDSVRFQNMKKECQSEDKVMDTL